MGHKNSQELPTTRISAARQYKDQIDEVALSVRAYMDQDQYEDAMDIIDQLSHHALYSVFQRKDLIIDLCFAGQAEALSEILAYMAPADQSDLNISYRTILSDIPLEVFLDWCIDINDSKSYQIAADLLKKQEVFKFSALVGYLAYSGHAQHALDRFNTLNGATKDKLQAQFNNSGNDLITFLQQHSDCKPVPAETEIMRIRPGQGVESYQLTEQ